MSATRAVRSIISRLLFVRSRSAVMRDLRRRDRDGLGGRWRGLVGLRRDAHRDAAQILERGEQPITVGTGAEPGALEGDAGLAVERGCIAIDVTVHFDVHRAGPRPHLHRLVDELAGRAARYDREDALDALRVAPHATWPHLHARAPWGGG